MSPRRRRAKARTRVCQCGGALLWVPYIPVDAAADPDRPKLTGPRSVLPFDRTPARPDAPDYPTANYAVLEGKTQARQITAERPLDETTERAHHIHYETCPQRVTPEQLVAMTQRNGRKR